MFMERKPNVVETKVVIKIQSGNFDINISEKNLGGIKYYFTNIEEFCKPSSADTGRIRFVTLNEEL